MKQKINVLIEPKALLRHECVCRWGEEMSEDKDRRLIDCLSNSNECHGLSIRAITDIHQIEYTDNFHSEHTSHFPQLHFSCLYRWATLYVTHIPYSIFSGTECYAVYQTPFVQMKILHSLFNDDHVVWARRTFSLKNYGHFIHGFCHIERNASPAGLYSRLSFSLIAYPIQFAVYWFSAQKLFNWKREYCIYRARFAKSTRFHCSIRWIYRKCHCQKELVHTWSRRYEKFIQGISYPNCWFAPLYKAHINGLNVQVMLLHTCLACIRK